MVFFSMQEINRWTNAVVSFHEKAQCVFLCECFFFLSRINVRDLSRTFFYSIQRLKIIMLLYNFCHLPNRSTLICNHSVSYNEIMIQISPLSNHLVNLFFKSI